MTARKYVGRPADAVDGLHKIRGKARFVGDYQLPGMLHTRVLRSPVPHARIVHLDVTPALEVPGVVAAITSEDFAGHSLWGWPIQDQYILAYRKALYAGIFASALRVVSAVDAVRLARGDRSSDSDASAVSVGLKHQRDGFRISIQKSF